MTDFDGAWKEALDAYFEPFMAFFFPQALDSIRIPIDDSWDAACAEPQYAAKQ